MIAVNHATIKVIGQPRNAIAVARAVNAIVMTDNALANFGFSEINFCIHSITGEKAPMTFDSIGIKAFHRVSFTLFIWRFIAFIFHA